MKPYEVPLGDVLTDVFQGAALTKVPDDAPAYVVLQPRDIDAIFVERLPAAQPAEVKASKQRLRPNDVLVSLRGQPMRAALFRPSEDVPTIVGNTLAVLRPNPTLVDPLFLAGLLRSRPMEDRLRSYYAGTSSGLSISLSELRKAMIPLPDLEIQMEFAHVFSAAAEYEMRTKQLLEKRRELIDAMLVDLMEA